MNIWGEKKRLEKLNCMHNNPVRRPLVAQPADWPWGELEILRSGGCVGPGHGPDAVIVASEKRRGAREHARGSHFCPF